MAAFDRSGRPQSDEERQNLVGSCRKRTTPRVKGFGRLRTKASSAGTRGPHLLVYG